MRFKFIQKIPFMYIFDKLATACKISSSSKNIWNSQSKQRIIFRTIRCFDNKEAVSWGYPRFGQINIIIYYCQNKVSLQANFQDGAFISLIVMAFICHFALSLRKISLGSLPKAHKNQCNNANNTVI